MLTMSGIHDYLESNVTDRLVRPGKKPFLSNKPERLILLYFEGIPDLMERTATTTITVMWYYTKEFADITTDPALYMAGLINHANTAYQNSNLNQKLETMCIEQLPDSFVEADDVGQLFTNFFNVKGIL